MNNPRRSEVQPLESRLHLAGDVTLATREFLGSTEDIAADAALQPDGKLVVVGSPNTVTSV